MRDGKADACIRTTVYKSDSLQIVRYERAVYLIPQYGWGCQNFSPKRACNP